MEKREIFIAFIGSRTLVAQMGLPGFVSVLPGCTRVTLQYLYSCSYMFMFHVNVLEVNEICRNKCKHEKTTIRQSLIVNSVVLILGTAVLFD
jgi:hypothetical protein